MQRNTGTIALALGLAAMTLGPTAALAAAQGPPPPGYYQGGQQEPWAGPPAEYRDDISRRGFHDGIEGARKDAQNHRPPNVNNRDEYRRPDVPGPVQREYRQAFRRGYQVGVQHLMNGGRY